MAAPAVSPRSTLEGLREIQAWGQSFSPAEPSPGATAPDYCLGASRFIVGKLVGLFPTNKHLNTFLGASSGAKALDMEGGRVRMAWGRLSAPKSQPDINCAADFNGVVLPAAIRWGHLRSRDADDIQYTSVYNNAAYGDQLLAQNVPIVVGVALGGSGTRDHFITLVTDRSGIIWTIDSWSNSTALSVVPLPAGSRLVDGVDVDLNAGQTRIPCPSPYIGYYRYRHSKTPLTLKIML